MSTHTLRRNHLNSSTYLKNISSTSNFPPLLHLHSQCVPGPTFTCLDYGPLRQPKTGLPTSTPTLLPPCQERGAGSFSKCKQCLFPIKSLWVTPSWPLGKWHSLTLWPGPPWPSSIASRPLALTTVRPLLPPPVSRMPDCLLCISHAWEP